jgi:Polysaccharide lyase family 4, domain II
MAVTLQCDAGYSNHFGLGPYFELSGMCKMQKDERDLLEVLKSARASSGAKSNARRTQIMGNNEFRKLSLWGALVALSLLGSTIAWSRSTSHPTASEGQAASASGSQSAASSGYVVRTIEQSTTGAISGRILYNGKPVVPKRFTVTSDTSVCGTTKEVYPVRIEEGGIADAVVWIDDIPSGKAFDFPSPMIDQKKCAFVPHVLVMKGGELKLGNTDLCMHNIHVISYANREANKAIPPGAAPQEITLARADRVTVRCDVHKWMSSYVVVAKNPYYVVSGAGGKFRLEGVPAGHYHLKVWQESLGELDQEITVEAAKTTETSFTYRAKGV